MASRRCEKKVLQKEFEELQVAYIISEQRFSAELQAAADKNKALQQEVEQLRVPQQISLRYGNELKAERGESDSLERRLERNSQHDFTTVEVLEEIKDGRKSLRRKKLSLQKLLNPNKFEEKLADESTEIHSNSITSP